MPKRFYKHKLLFDEHSPPRQRLARFNERFDVKHIAHDRHLGRTADAAISDLAVAQQRLILTSNVRDFCPLLRTDSPGVIGIPEHPGDVVGRAAGRQAHAAAHPARPGLLPGPGPHSGHRGGEARHGVIGR